MRKTEDIVCYDFQGWPEYKMNLREILLALGGQQDGNFIKFPSNTPLMDIYPRILVDDGMGYGVDENVIVSVDIDPQDEYINIFRERKPTDEEQAELARQEDSHMNLDRLEDFIKALETNNQNHYCPVKFYQSESWRSSSGF